MRTQLETVNQFLDLTSPKGRDIDVLLPQISTLLAENFVFTGPLMKIEGRENYLELLRKFLGVHVGLVVKQQFADNDNVCSINDLTVKSPAGALVKMPMAELFGVKGGVIHTHEIFYDPREFRQGVRDVGQCLRALRYSSGFPKRHGEAGDGVFRFGSERTLDDVEHLEA